RAGVGGRAPRLARARRAAAGEERRGEIGALAEVLAGPLPLARDPGRDREALGGVALGGLEQRGERQPAEALREDGPTRDGARHRDGVPAHARDLVGPEEARGVEAARRAARGVEAVQA